MNKRNHPLWRLRFRTVGFLCTTALFGVLPETLVGVVRSRHASDEVTA